MHDAFGSASETIIAHSVARLFPHQLRFDRVCESPGFRPLLALSDDLRAALVGFTRVVVVRALHKGHSWLHGQWTKCDEAQVLHALC